jgi:hypothetical protein
MNFKFFAAASLMTTVMAFQRKFVPLSNCAFRLNPTDSSPADSSSLPASRGDIECRICLDLAKRVFDDVKGNKTEGKIIQSLEGVCQNVLVKKRTNCDDFVEQYANELIGILVEAESPGSACGRLGVC